MRVKYLAQEHNAVPRPGLEPGPPDPESSALTIRPPRLPRPFTGSKKTSIQPLMVNFVNLLLMSGRNQQTCQFLRKLSF